MSDNYEFAGVCKGAWELGNACGTCPKCIATKPEPGSTLEYDIHVMASKAREHERRASELMRVACISLDGTTLYTEAKQFTDLGIGDDDEGETYTLTFKTMTRADYEALGEFDGF